MVSGSTRGRRTSSRSLVELGAFGPAVTFLWFVGLTNAYNFMDGLDALAGSSSHVTDAVGDGPAAILHDIGDRLEISWRRATGGGAVTT